MHLCFAAIVIAAICGCVVLVLAGHPWFAIAVLLAGSGISMKGDD
jgi:hypothetical protein